MTVATLFDFVCARDPARTLTVDGASLLVCQRCFGIYAGALAQALARCLAGPWRARSMVGLNALLVLAFVPLGLSGVPEDPWLRYLTGAIFGAAVAGLVAPGGFASARRVGGPALRGAVLVSMIAAPFLLHRAAAGRTVLDAVIVLGAASLLGFGLAALAAWSRTQGEPVA